MILFLLSKDKLKHDSTYQVLHGTIFGCMVLTDWTDVLSGKDYGWVRNLTVCAWVSAHVPKTLSSHTWNLNGGWIVKTSQIVVQLSQKGLECERFPTLLRVFDRQEKVEGTVNFVEECKKITRDFRIVIVCSMLFCIGPWFSFHNGQWLLPQITCFWRSDTLFLKMCRSFPGTVACKKYFANVYNYTNGISRKLTHPHLPNYPWKGYVSF